MHFKSTENHVEFYEKAQRSFNWENKEWESL